MRCIKYGLSAFNILVKPNHVNATPIYFQIEPTTLCNLNCKMCSRTNRIQRKIIPTIKNMPVSEFKKIIESIDPSSIQLCGQGEPFLNHGLLNMIEIASKRNTNVSIISNFILPDDSCIQKLVKVKLNLLKVSLDSASAYTYTKIRGKDKFEKVINNIQLIQTNKKKLKSKTPYVRLQFCIQKDNYMEMVPFLRLAKQVKADAICFQPLELTDSEDKFGELVGKMSRSELHRIINIARDEAHKLSISTNLDDLATDFDFHWHKYEWDKIIQHAPTVSKKQICLLPWFSTYITVDGEVKPCCRFSREKISFGNLMYVPFKKIWNSAEYQKFRADIKKGHLIYKVCRDCKIKDALSIFQMRKILPGILKRGNKWILT